MSTGLHPEGTFIATPKYYEAGESSKQGTEYIAVTFAIEETGQQLMAYLYLTPNTWKRTAESLRACGWSGTDFADFVKSGAPGFGTAKVKVVVEHEEYQEKVRAKIKWVNRISTPAKSGFGSSFKENLATLDAPPAPAVPIDEILKDQGEIPF